ncbi:DNA alkylation repair protein [Maritalea porphyrae]|uniref:DNA alkylation repair protein n=1 Tax=Maritalea porphyrae TaxID=880732 RepID=UPI0022B05F22|nr:DNA alkylation repair protein [Maritalea porphyrae]MCZ4273874.1 DNA alkylation repair protein [Maritalea porphyrae]
MALSSAAQEVYDRIDRQNPRMGEVKKLATAIKQDHSLALELWSTGEFGPRLVATLILNKSELSKESIEQLAADIANHPPSERDKLSEWLMAHQLMKSKRTTALLESWEHHASPVLRRLFWYHQGRLRWTGKVPPNNTQQLLTSLENNLGKEDPQVQWAMNFTAGQIGIHDPQYRDQCIGLGERLGLYKGDHTSPGCTPNYLPEFIRIEVGKLK